MVVPTPEPPHIHSYTVDDVTTYSEDSSIATDDGQMLKPGSTKIHFLYKNLDFATISVTSIYDVVTAGKEYMAGNERATFGYNEKQVYFIETACEVLKEPRNRI